MELPSIYDKCLLDLELKTYMAKYPAESYKQLPNSREGRKA